jgi:hypothetical protein
MGQKSRISAVLAVFTDGANLKKWGQIWKIGANFADFCGFRHALPIRGRLGVFLFFVKFWRRRLWDKKRPA